MSEQKPESGELVVVEENKPTQPATTQPEPYVEEYIITEDDGGGGGIGGCLWPIVAIVAIIVGTPALVFVFMVATGMGTAGGMVDSFFGGISNILAPKPTTLTVHTSQTLVSQIKPMGQLVGTSVELAMANIDVDINRGGPNLCGVTSTHVAEATIQAGVDLSQLEEGSIIIDDEVITLRLPEPQLTSCDITYIEEYKRTNTICRVDQQEIRFLAEFAAMRQFRDDVLDSGILETTRVNTTTVLQGFVQAVTGQPVQIEFVSVENPDLPPTCDPDLPNGWQYDEETGQWTTLQ